VVVNVFLLQQWFNHFAEGNQIQSHNFVRKPHKKILTSQLTHCVLLP